MQSEDYKALEAIKKNWDKLGFQTRLYSISKEIPVPVLTIALQTDYKEDVLALDLAFTPFSKEEIQYTRFLQMSIELETDVTEENKNDILQFANQVNTMIPLGQFTILNNRIAYRYTYPMSNAVDAADNSCLETISLYSVLAIEYSTIFSKLASGIITLSEACSSFLDNKF